jgi:Transposase domain (DUF772)
VEVRLMLAPRSTSDMPSVRVGCYCGESVCGCCYSAADQMEQLDYNLLFRWFVGLNMDDTIWDVTVFTTKSLRLERI